MARVDSDSPESASPTGKLNGKCSAEAGSPPYCAMAYSAPRSITMQSPTPRMTPSTKYPCHIVEP